MGSSVVPSCKCRHGLLLRRLGAIKRAWRASTALVACIATIFALGAQPIGSVPASAQLVAAGNPVDATTGCPRAIGVDLGPGQRCVSWPVSMFLQESENANGGCGQATFMLVPLSKNADGYLALWNRTGPNADPSPSDPWEFTSTTGGPYGEEIWSTTTITPQKTGVDVNYDVPAGDGAWFVSAGGGPCSALGSAEEVVGVAQAWAVTYKREVGGQVTVEGSAAPAPGITINANCPSGGTTATSANGYYDFLLDKGTCIIAPELQPGDTSTPVQRVLDVTTDINNVNFLVPCDAVPLGTGGGSTDGAFRPALASSATGPCRLIVSATPIDGGRSGLSLINGTATFLADADDLQGACASGCTDVKVTVTDAQGKAVEGATVVAHFTAVPPSDVAPREHGPTFGLVCHLDQVRDADGKLIALNETDACSSGAADETQMTISGTTDTKGQVFFRYWVPGLIGDASVKVSITATARGGGCGCFVRTGHGATGFGEKPYLLFDRGPVAVPEKTAVWLPIYAATHNGVAVTLASLLAAFKLGKLVGASENLIETLLGVLHEGSGEVIKDGVTPPLDTSEGMAAALFKLVNVPSDKLGQNFIDAFSAGKPLNGDTNSPIWNLGWQLYSVYEGANGPGFPTSESLKMTFYEVSQCDADGPCGTPPGRAGYSPTPGDPETHYPGIEPLLYVELEDYIGSKLFYSGGAAFPYQAQAWLNEALGSSPPKS